MWPDLYALMKPIRQLMEKPLSQHQWKSEHYEAWDQAREYMIKEMSFMGMDIDTDTDEDGDNSDKVVPEGNIQKPEAVHDIKKCMKQRGHPLCSLHLTRGASLTGPNLGLSENALKILNITPPLTTRISVGNLAYGVNEAKLYEVFSMSGNIVELILHRYDHGESKGTATVQYAHPLEAVQTIKMFKKAKLFSRDLKVEQDKIGPTPTMSSKKLPEGLVDVEGGIAMGGSRL